MWTHLDVVKKWRAVPSAFRSLNNIADARAKGEFAWDKRCPIPISAAITYLVETNTTNAGMYGAELTAAWAWDKTKVAYIFDPELAQSLSDQAKDTKDTDVLPIEVITYLPYPCVYISTNAITDNILGFFAWVEDDMNTHVMEMRVQWLLSDGRTIPGMIHLLPGETIGKCIEDTLLTMKKNVQDDPNLLSLGIDAYYSTKRCLMKSLQFILYLVSDDADMSTPAKKKTAKKKGKGNTVNDRDKVTEVTVGVRIGSAFRKARQRADQSTVKTSEGVKLTKAPHMRRGHWHRYWTGPLKGERKLIVKWTAPIAVHGDKKPNETVSEIPVRKQK